MIMVSIWIPTSIIELLISLHYPVIEDWTLEYSFQHEFDSDDDDDADVDDDDVDDDNDDGGDDVGGGGGDDDGAMMLKIVVVMVLSLMVAIVQVISHRLIVSSQRMRIKTTSIILHSCCLSLTITIPSLHHASIRHPGSHL